MKLHQYTLVAAIVLLLGATKESHACQCREPQPPCAEYHDANAVFIGSVVKMVPVSRAEGEPPLSTQVRFKVDRAFTGVKDPDAELINWGSSCDYSFKEGHVYLVYAFRNPKTGSLSTHVCSRTRELSEAKDDLTYIAKAADGAPEKLIVGVLGDGQKKLAKVNVTAKGNGKLYRSLSDSRGWFKLTVSDPGRYELRLFLPLDVDVAGTSDLMDKINAVSRTKRHHVVKYVVEVKTVGCTFIDVPLMIPWREAEASR